MGLWLTQQHNYENENNTLFHAISSVRLAINQL